MPFFNYGDEIKLMVPSTLNKSNCPICGQYLFKKFLFFGPRQSCKSPACTLLKSKENGTGKQFYLASIPWSQFPDFNTVYNNKLDKLNTEYTIFQNIPSVYPTTEEMSNFAMSLAKQEYSTFPEVEIKWFDYYSDGDREKKKILFSKLDKNFLEFIE